jgi:transposase
MAKQYSKEFKEDAVRYFYEHEDLGVSKCAKNLGISKSALSAWKQAFEEHNGEVPTRGRGNYESDEAKENARLRKELRDAQDALEILKKAISILGN